MYKWLWFKCTTPKEIYCGAFGCSWRFKRYTSEVTFGWMLPPWVASAVDAFVSFSSDPNVCTNNNTPRSNYSWNCCYYFFFFFIGFDDPLFFRSKNMWYTFFNLPGIIVKKKKLTREMIHPENKDTAYLPYFHQFPINRGDEKKKKRVCPLPQIEVNSIKLWNKLKPGFIFFFYHPNKKKTPKSTSTFSASAGGVLEISFVDTVK